MLTKRIIPCLDVDGGRVVKGKNFIELKDAGDPVESAIRYDQQGADELVFLDITASSDNRNTVFEIIKKTAETCFMPLTVGGGIRSLEDIKKILMAGGDKAAMNTASIKNPDLISQSAKAFGSQCIVVAMDAKKITNKNQKPKWEIFTHGGRNPTGIDAIKWAYECQERGAGEILLTSMDADGTGAGYDLELTSKISRKLKIPVIASGGAGNLEHLAEAFTIGKADAVLAASIFHYGKYSIATAKEFLHAKKIPIRGT